MVFMTGFERIKDSAAALAGSAAKTGAVLLKKGKQQMDLLALETKLSKAQRQLGALVYSLHKSGEANEELVQRYISVIAGVEQEITSLQQSHPSAATTVSGVATVLCPGCGAEVDPDAIFCPGCGNKLA